MSVTFSGAFTFNGGGLTLTMAPPSTPTAGWFAGGNPGAGSTSIVDRITYATDTATATVRGPLNGTRYAQGATGTLTYGWYGGTRITTAVSLVSRITYATDTATASARGPLSYSAYWLTATGTDTYGWFGGGYTETPSFYSRVSRIDYSNDTATATSKGPLSISVAQLAATTDSTTYGWYGAGYNSGTLPTSTVSRITYATDTATATSKGPLSLARNRLAATGTTSYGWYATGFTGPYFSTVDRIDYSTDTATASVRGPLSVARFAPAASTDGTTYGWFGGGYTGVAPGIKSLVDRITFATDTATATARGPLSRSTYMSAATSGLQ